MMTFSSMIMVVVYEDGLFVVYLAMGRLLRSVSVMILNCALDTALNIDSYKLR